VLKVQHKPIKRYRLGFKRKEQKKPKRTLVWRIGLSGVPPDSVQCTTGQCLVPRVVRLQTCHLRVSGEPLRYNSPDCPVCQRSNGSGTTVDSNGHLQKRYSADSSHRVRVAPEGAPDSEQDLSGAAPDCLVRHRTVWCGTGLSGAAPNCPVPKLSELQRSKPSEP
jgi:hypothetical protein